MFTREIQVIVLRCHTAESWHRLQCLQPSEIRDADVTDIIATKVCGTVHVQLKPKLHYTHEQAVKYAQQVLAFSAQTSVNNYAQFESDKLFSQQ